MDVSLLNYIKKEFEEASTNTDFRKEFLYSNGVLSGYVIYSDKLEVPLFFVSLLFEGGSLHSKTILRISDNAIVTLRCMPIRRAP